MAIDPRNIHSEDDFLKVGADATATFDNSRSNPTEHASSENLRAPTSEDDDLEEEEEDIDEDDGVDGEEDDEEDEDEDEDIDEEDDEEEEDDDLVKGMKAPRAYRML